MESREICFSLQLTRIKWYGILLEHSVLSLQNSLSFLIRMSIVLYGSQSSRCLSGARSRIVSLQCTTHLQCRWKKISSISSLIREEFVRKHTISFWTEMRLVAVVSESSRMISRKWCSRHLALQKSRLTASSDSFWMHLNTEFRRTQDLLTVLTVLLCLWQNRTASVTWSRSRR